MKLRQAIFLLLLVDLLVIFLIFSPKKSEAKNDANRIYQSCFSLISKEDCYAQKFYELTKKTNLENAVSTLYELQKIDPKNSTGCHFISHKISIAETEKNPEKWGEVIKKIKPYECTGGYIHGVLEARFEKDKSFKLTADTVDLICNKILGGKQFFIEPPERSCTHIMGHLLMIENAGLIDRSISSCDKLTDYAAKYECKSGVFMENITREGLVGHGLAKPLPWTRENASKIEELCNKYDAIAQEACWREISHMYETIYNDNPLDVYNACNKAPNDPDRTECYIHGLGNMVSSPSFEQKKLTVACSVFSTSDSRFTTCMYQVVGGLLASSEKNADKALYFCDNIDSEFKSTCYGFLLDSLKRINVSEGALKNTCSKVPANFQQGKCTVYSEIDSIKNTTSLAEQTTLYKILIDRVGVEKAQEALYLSGLPFDGQTHLLNHEVGEYLYKKYKEKGLIYCKDYFLSSCYHGFVIMAVADKGYETLKNVMDICWSKGYPVAGQCAHAIGHGLLTWYGYKNLPQALEGCDKLSGTSKNFPLFNCYDGVFMENVFAVHEGGKPSKYRWVSDADYIYPCDSPKISEKYINACWAEQPSLMYRSFNGDLERVGYECLKLQNSIYQRTCFDAIARQIHPNSKGNPAEVLRNCNLMPSEWINSCIISVAGTELSVGGKVLPYELCSRIGESSKTDCYRRIAEVIATNKFADRKDLCNKIPILEQRNNCLALN